MVFGTIRVTETIPETIEQPRVGVGVIVHFPGEGIAWIHRHGATHGNNEWSVPGGRLEFMEDLVTCALREVREEIGVEMHTLRPIPIITEDKFPKENQHWITHYFIGEPKSNQRPSLMEAHKANGLLITYQNPPGKMFPGVSNVIGYLRNNGDIPLE